MTSAIEKDFSFILNGQAVHVHGDASVPLLYILRNDFALNGPKFGCGLGECGACCVLIDGQVARACVVALGGIEDREVTTLEGLGARGSPGLVQTAFIQAQAAQCGYCLNGMIMTTHAFLLRNPDPSRGAILQALRYNLCRCGTHVEIVTAVEQAAVALRRDAAQ